MIGYLSFALLLVSVASSNYIADFSLFNLTQPKNDAVFDSVCIGASRGARVCTMEIAYGCLCYNNGTCERTEVNKCSDCSSNDVFGVIYGECPKVHPYLCSAEKAAQSGSSTSRALELGCACTKDGKCEIKNFKEANKCKGANDLAFFPWMACPAENLQKKPVKSDDTPTKEVICTPALQNRQIMCSLVANTFGCTTFTDGSQRYMAVNACTCQNKSIVKYVVNQKCEDSQ